MAATAAKSAPRSIVSWITTLSLIIAGLIVLVAGALSTATVDILAFLIIALFAALFFVFGFGSWRGKRWGYLGGIIMSVLIVLLFGNPVDTASNPGNPIFPFTFTIIVTNGVAIIYGAYGLYTARRPNPMPIQIPRASVLGLLAIGVALGGLFVGGFAGVTQNRLLSNRAVHVDITIRMGAALLTTTAFSPDNFTVRAGTTVTWLNGDSTPHTVTSNTAGAFDSGSIASGATYAHTFSQAGTYNYYCAIHPNMIGTIIVTS